DRGGQRPDVARVRAGRPHRGPRRRGAGPLRSRPRHGADPAVRERVMTADSKTGEKAMESTAKDVRENRDNRPHQAPPAREPEPQPAKRPSRVRRVVVWLLVAIVAGGGIVFGLRTIAFYRHHAETDDAQVEAHIAPVLPKVSGFVTQVLVQDNQRVEAGQVLV